MLVENCELLNKAKALATQKGLDPSKVVCGGCTDGRDCPYDSSMPLLETSQNPEEEYTLKEVKDEFFPNWTPQELRGSASH